MNAFVQLFFDLEQTQSTREKVHVLVRYFQQTGETEGCWVPALFLGKTGLKRISSRILKEAAMEVAEIPEWLFQETYQVVGDLAETIAGLVSSLDGKQELDSLSGWMQWTSSLRSLSEEDKKTKLKEKWTSLDRDSCLVLNKLMTGGFRIGVSQQLLVRALAQVYGLEPAKVAHRLMGQWKPETETLASLLLDNKDAFENSKPYPFMLSHALVSVEDLDAPGQYQAEWKWDGIRAQLICRGGQWFLWSRGEELINASFPEFAISVKIFPEGTVLDGELLAWKEGRVLDFSLLQNRISRKKITEKWIREVPVVFMMFDLLEWGGEDIRMQPGGERRLQLEKLGNGISHPLFPVSPQISFENYNELTEIQKRAREKLTEGIMVKRKLAPYGVGRKRGDWWKWKVEPYSIDAVLLYAQFGHGRRADLFTDYTFAVWHGDRLVTFAKAYSGLTDEEIRQVDAFIKKNTREKYGPVRTVVPALVFEIAFEGIQASNRHKSGIAVRFPRIVRWRKDKKPEDADTLECLHSLLRQKLGQRALENL